MRCICYYCSGLSNKNKPLYKICRSLYELKNHCRDRHNGEIEKCIVNYSLPDEYVEIEPQKKKLRYIMNFNHILEVDRNDILAYQIVGEYGPQNYFKCDNLKIKIYGENILTLNESGFFVSYSRPVLGRENNFIQIKEKNMYYYQFLNNYDDYLLYISKITISFSQSAKELQNYLSALLIKRF